MDTHEILHFIPVEGHLFSRIQNFLLIFNLLTPMETNDSEHSKEDKKGRMDKIFKGMVQLNQIQSQHKYPKN